MGSAPRSCSAFCARSASGSRSIVGHRHILDFRDVSELRCVSADGRPVPLHVDGDHIGDVTEAVCGILPGVLRVVA